MASRLGAALARPARAENSRPAFQHYVISVFQHGSRLAPQPFAILFSSSINLLASAGRSASVTLDAVIKFGCL